METNTGLRIFKDATAIVTGSASGIGKALTIELSKRGCEVVLADIQYEKAQEVASQIQSLGGKASAKKVDVRNYDEMKKLVEETVQKTGRLDYMFNNAGAGVMGAACNYTIDDWNLIIDINLRGEINGIQAAYPVMLKQKFGQIVNTASVAGLTPAPGNIVYSATKHAIVGLSQSLRIEAAVHGIRINVLCPGAINTPMIKGEGEFNKSLVNKSPEEIEDIFKMLNPIEADVFARDALNLVAKDKGIIILPAEKRSFVFMYKLFPEMIINGMRKKINKKHPELLIPKEE